MATQGIISIVKDKNVIFKCVCGCNGMTASKTAEKLKELKNFTLDEIYNVCVENKFGCKDCLVVQSVDDYKSVDELPDLYKKKFQNAEFNPRWDYGSADYVEIINI